MARQRSGGSVAAPADGLEFISERRALLIRQIRWLSDRESKRRAELVASQQHFARRVNNVECADAVASCGRQKPGLGVARINEKPIASALSRRPSSASRGTVALNRATYGRRGVPLRARCVCRIGTDQTCLARLIGGAP